MSEAPLPPEEDATGDLKHQDLTDTRKAFLRMAVLQTVLSVVGVVVAVIALYAALGESAAVRQQTAASVWPFAQFSIDDYDTGDRAGFKMQIANVGVGPARMRHIRIDLAGRTVRNVDGLLETAGAADAPIARNFITNRVLSPGQAVEVLATSDPALARKLAELVTHPESAITYCYCSIFEDCWVVDSRRDVQSPDPVTACPDFADRAFSL